MGQASLRDTFQQTTEFPQNIAMCVMLSCQKHYFSVWCFHVFSGGKNALAIHYIKNDSSIERDDLVLVDCGCDLHGYVSDVTRTWPVSGKCVATQW